MDQSAVLGTLPDVREPGPGHHPPASPFKLTLGVIGIVFGDIGTSPLYAFRETFAGHHPLAVDRLHIFGVLSLRHTWASWHRQNDVPTWVLQELGGWKSAEMVRRYAHLSVKHLAPYADQLTFPVTQAVAQQAIENVETGAGEGGHKNGHSPSRPRLRIVAGTDLSH